MICSPHPLCPEGLLLPPSLVPPTYQAYSCLRAFACAVLATRLTLETAVFTQMSPSLGGRLGPPHLCPAPLVPISCVSPSSFSLHHGSLPKILYDLCFYCLLFVVCLATPACCNTSSSRAGIRLSFSLMYPMCPVHGWCSINICCINESLYSAYRAMITSRFPNHATFLKKHNCLVA